MLVWKRNRSERRRIMEEPIIRADRKTLNRAHKRGLADWAQWATKKTIDAECSTSMAKQNNRESLAGKAGGGRDNAPASA